MTYKKKPKKQNPYPKLLNEFERKRTRDWVIDKASQRANLKKISQASKIQKVKQL